ncbi:MULTISPECIES: class I SAM-dependent methyltransferase [unclassified Agromyces]|uniref:class I SAM-dependent methyltransferase n=1 Tax=unclassified Agromyces TaxID=2639701 RepID=UPI0030151810
MGDVRAEPDFVASFEGGWDAFADLDEVIWNPISRATVLRSQPRFDERVLDACAGDGATALPTAELVGPGGVVDAVDLAEPLVELIRERAGDRMPQLRTHVGDVTTWPYTGYDLVQCVLGILFFDDPEAGTRHLVECVRPGGRAVFTVWAAGAMDRVGELLAEALPADDDRVPSFDDARRAAIVGADTPGNFAHWLSERGLVDVRAEAVPRHLELDPDLAWRIVTGTGFRAFVGGLDDESRDAVRERLAAGLADAPATVDLTTLVGVGHRPPE